jgi:hypothetical protein
MGAVGGLLMRQLEGELREARNELAKLKRAEAAAGRPPVPAPVPATRVERVEAGPPEPAALAAAPALVKQPALWFAVAGWAVAFVLLFRRRSI